MALSKKRGNSMGRIPNKLRLTIAQNIRECRKKKFPGRGGCKKCAEAFGVSPQQWSPWERGGRTPDEIRLQDLAEFFGTTVDWMRRDHTQPRSEPLRDAHAETPPPRHGRPPPGAPQSGEDAPSSRSWRDEPPGSVGSIFWLNRHFFHYVMSNGITVRLDQRSIDAICERLKQLHS